MRRSLSCIALTGLLSVTACSGSAELGAEGPTVAPAPSESTDSLTPGPDDGRDEGSDPTPPDPTDPAPDRSAPPLVLPAMPPGTDEAYDALIAELERFVTDEQLAAGVPWPDLRNPDPIAAYRSCAEFQGWMAENNPTPILVEAYTAPGSPERAFDLDLFSTMAANDLVATPSVPPYSMDVHGLVHPAATGITDALLARVPDGSAAVVYYDSVGIRQLVRPDGSVFSIQGGWVDEGPWVAIMAPTEVGWQVWWDELTETPPPSLQDRPSPGEAVTPTPRPDV